MALDFSTDIDHTFLEDNFLSPEDWGFQDGFLEKDIGNDGVTLESFGITLGPDQAGVRDDISSNSSTKSWNSLEDDFIPTIDVEVKGEPSSPSLSQGSSDTAFQQNTICDEIQIKLESPPLTPPHEFSQPLLQTQLLNDNSDELVCEEQPQANLLNGGLCLSSNGTTHNGYIIQNHNQIAPGRVQIMNGTVPKGTRIVNGGLNVAPSSKGMIVPNSNCVPKVVMTTSGLPNGIKVQVVNGGTKRLANGTIKTGGRNSARKGAASAPKRDANGITIHQPIVPKVDGIHVNGVPATIGMAPMPAAKTIVFTQSAIPNGEVKPARQATAPQQSLNACPSKPTLSPHPPEDVMDSKEMIAWKRQQRMIKNRESASLSRKKKKEYVQTLEHQMKDMSIENEMLKEENMNLKKRLCALEEEVERLKGFSTNAVSPMSGKYVTCLLAVILFIGFNLTPFSIIGSKSSGNEYILSSHHGRNLLGFEDSPENRSRASSSSQMADIKDQYYNKTLLRLHDESSQHHLRQSEEEEALFVKHALNCSFLKRKQEPMLNAKLLDALKKLAPDEELFKQEDLNMKQDKKNLRRKKKMKQHREKRMKIQKASWQVESGERSLQIYDNLFIRQYENLIKSLERREDTYYIVSFTRDHLLLPAMSHNSTQRPKMSLVMPAGGNASMWDARKDHMTMMQIDCEVTNTKTVYVPDFREDTFINETHTSPPSDQNQEHPTDHSSDSPSSSNPPPLNQSSSSTQSFQPPPLSKPNQKYPSSPFGSKFKTEDSILKSGNITKT